jgi:hypothetical protein
VLLDWLVSGVDDLDDDDLDDDGDDDLDDDAAT